MCILEHASKRIAYLLGGQSDMVVYDTIRSGYCLHIALVLLLFINKVWPR